MNTLSGSAVVVTGAASGIGLEMARRAAREGMRVVMADVRAADLDAAAHELSNTGAQIVTRQVDVSKPDDIEALAAFTQAQFGAPHMLFNNAGVGCGGLIWEYTRKDWEWVLGVNLMGVVHGVRVFAPMMLAAARADPRYRGHIVNTASMAGLLNPPNMGAYNASKHAVVSLSETLYHDLGLVTQQVHAHVLCPYFVPTGIVQSTRARPAALSDESLMRTPSQRAADEMLGRAVAAGKVSAAEVARCTFEAVHEGRFYIYSHPEAVEGVRARMQDVLGACNPGDPFHAHPQLGRALKQALLSEG